MATFTKRDGTEVEVEDYTISAADMTSILRLKEDFEEREEYLSLRGVVLQVLSRGDKAIRNSWKSGEVNKNRRDFSKEAAHCFNEDGSVKDAETLAKLAIAKGLVKGSKREV